MNISNYMIPVSQMDKDDDRQIERKYLFPNGYEVKVFDRSTTYNDYEEEYEIRAYQDGTEIPALRRGINYLGGYVDLMLEKYSRLPSLNPTKDEITECPRITTVKIQSLCNYKILESNGQSDIYELPNGVLVEVTWNYLDEKVEKVRVKTGLLWIDFPAENLVDLEMLLHLMAKA